jgi:hypothetical protein
MNPEAKLTNSPEWLLGLPVFYSFFRAFVGSSKNNVWVAIAITMSLLVGQLH